MRVHRALAQAGVASRRAAERLVAEGRVTVNGAPAQLGQTVSGADRLEVDGRPVAAQDVRTYLLNKPAGVVSTASDPQGRPTVLDELPDAVRLYPVGRLDLDTTGALLVTNDGDLAHRLMHPRSSVPKVYEALVRGPRLGGHGAPPAPRGGAGGRAHPAGPGRGDGPAPSRGRPGCASRSPRGATARSGA